MFDLLACYTVLLFFIRLIHVCLSNDEVEPQWMTVLETESVFKNFIYILENSLNGRIQEIFEEIGICQPDTRSMLSPCFDTVLLGLHFIHQSRMKHLNT